MTPQLAADAQLWAGRATPDMSPLNLAPQPPQPPQPHRHHEGNPPMLDLLTRAQALTVPATPPPAVAGLPPTGAPHPGPASRSRVFTGDWLANGCDCHIYTDGYAGNLVRRWNGWAVFRTTRAVAETIVAHHQNTFIQVMASHAGGGEHMADAWLATVRQFASITWLGGLIVVDRRLYSEDETDLEVTTPDTESRYTIGWGWVWDDVDATDVHTLHGGSGR